MTILKLIAIAFVCLGCSITIAEDQNNLTFNKTQQWNKKYFEHINFKSNLNIETDAIDLPPPPANSSLTTKNELKNLVDLQNNRTSLQNSKIDYQQFAWGFEIGSFKIRCLQQDGYTELAKLFTDVMPILGQTIFRLKHRFDRVRPSFLEPKLKTALPNPDHPSYPSGHASEAFTYALVLSHFIPENRQAYLDSALEIAHNREIAGLHYASDSKAGQELATKFVKQMLDSKDTRVKELIKKAKLELKLKGEPKANATCSGLQQSSE